MNHGSVHGFVHVLVYGLVHGFVSGTWFMVHGVLHYVLLEHGGLPCIFPFNVNPDFRHYCDPQWYLRLLSELSTLTLRPLRPLKVSLIMFYLNMVDYLMSSLLLST